MSWLRLDDGFTEHPKLEGWTVAQKWAWLEVLVYCARRETEGRIPDVGLLPRNVTPALLVKAADSGLADRHDDGSLHVHDWADYNPPREGVAELVADYLSKHPEASANDVAKGIGGNRKRILKAVRQFRSGSNSGTGSGSRVVPPSGSESGYARGHAPASPSPDPVKAKPAPAPVPEPRPLAADPPADRNGAGAGAADEADLEHRRRAAAAERRALDQPDRLDARAELERVLADSGGTA